MPGNLCPVWAFLNDIACGCGVRGRPGGVHCQAGSVIVGNRAPFTNPRTFHNLYNVANPHIIRPTLCRVNYFGQLPGVVVRCAPVAVDE